MEFTKKWGKCKKHPQLQNNTSSFFRTANKATSFKEQFPQSKAELSIFQISKQPTCLKKREREIHVFFNHSFY